MFVVLRFPVARLTGAKTVGYLDFQSGPEVPVREAPERGPIFEIPPGGVDVTPLENVLSNLWMDGYD